MNDPAPGAAPARNADPAAHPRALAARLAALLALASTDVLAQTCPGAAAPLTRVVSGCFPNDCVSVQSLGWGSFGLSPPRVDVPKFDPSLGTLLQVDLVFEARQLGNLCVDNLVPSCNTVQLDVLGKARLVPATGNAPAVTGVGPLQIVGLSLGVPPGFVLGDSDGVDDCAQPTGPPSTGVCVPGADHVRVPFDDTFVLAAASLGGADLAAWVAAAPGEVVRFDSSYTATLSGGSTGGMAVGFHRSGRVRLEVAYTFCPATLGVPYCDCAAARPCGNAGAAGVGCLNSTGRGARLAAAGSASVAAGDLVLRGEDLPPGRAGLFVQGTLTAGPGATYGDGLRCVAGTLVALEVGVASAGGQSATTSDLAQRGGVAPGDLRRYQLWYRDPLAPPCGAGFNGSNGLEVVWSP